MLGALAMKFNWRKKMQQAGKPTDKPNIVFGNNAQVALKLLRLSSLRYVIQQHNLGRSLSLFRLC